jgi:peptide/nickel transport system substrate-binding protein
LGLEGREQTLKQDYWQRALAGRLSRRRALAASGAAGLGLGALALAGCGGGGGGSSSSGGESSLLAKVEDTTKSAVPGGTYESFEASDIQGFDPNGGSSARAQLISYNSYLRLLKTKTTFNGIRSQEPEGDLAESWEFSGDGLQLTLKLRPNVIWDRRDPTNGRAVDSQDVTFSAERFLRLSPNAVNFFHSKSDAAPIESVQAVDNKTIALKLAFPYVPLLATFTRALNMWILPRESESKFDPKLDVRGAGPWILTNYKPSALLEFKRNPDYYVKDRPFFNGYSAPIVPEYATQLAQFRAGNIWAGVARQEDILGLKRDIPQLQMFKGDYGTGTPCFFFGFQGPWKDARMRQALSYIVDRQLLADTASGTKEFQDAGLPSTIRLNNFIGAGWEGYWIDPQSKEMGDAAKYFKVNIPEAKKLVSAAGQDNLSTKFYYPSNGYGAVYQQWVQILSGIIAEAGVIDAKLAPLDYQSEYVPNIHFGGSAIGAWDGFALTPAAQGDDAGHQLLVQFHSAGAATRQPKGVDPKLDSMIDDANRETDENKRITKIKDIQRYMPTTMIAVPVTYQSAGFGLNWPWIGNAGAARGGSVPYAELYPYLWFDKPTYDKVKS